MIINVLANGDIKNIKPENIYQGSNDANTIYLLAPFSANVNALINFELPQTHEIKGEFMFDAPTQISSELNMWTLKVNHALTEYYGDVKYQIRFVSNSQVIAVARGQFKVYEGVFTDLTEVPPEDVFVKILGNLTTIKADLLNGNLEARALKEYSEAYNYSLNSYVVSNQGGVGKIYYSKIENNKGNPLTDTNSWGAILLDEYDLAIRTQEDFDAFCDSLESGTCTAKSVLFIGDGGTLEFTREVTSVLRLPNTLKRIVGTNDAKIKLTIPTTDMMTKPLMYETTPLDEDSDYILDGIEFTLEGSASALGLYGFRNIKNCKVNNAGFYECSNISNTHARLFATCKTLEKCTADNTATTGVGTFAFYNSEFLVNCHGKSRYGAPVGGAFYNCKYLVNCVGSGTYAFSGCDYLVNCIDDVDRQSTRGVFLSCTHINATLEDIEEVRTTTQEILDRLVDYYTKNETYSKEEVDNLVNTIPKFGVEVVSEKPTSNISETTIYLVRAGSESENLYDEYIYVNGQWEYLGSQRIASGSATNVVDNLTSQSSTSALSARQGNVLYNMIVDSDKYTRKQLLLGADGVLNGDVYSFTVQDANSYLGYRTNLTKFLVDLHLPIAGAIDTTKEVAITFGDTTYYVFNILKGMEHVTIGDLNQVDKYNNETGYRFIAEMTFFETNDVVGFAIIPTISMSDILALDSDQMDNYMADGGLTQGQLAMCKKVTTNGYDVGAVYRFDVQYPNNYSWTQISYSKSGIDNIIQSAIIDVLNTEV
jgi:hypothetical protein